MTELKQKYFSSAYTVFFCLLTVYMAVREVLPLNFLIESTVVSGAIFACAFILIAVDLFTEQKCIRSRISDLLILFLGFSVISSVVNIKYGYFGNIKIIAALAIEFLVVFPFAVDKDKKQINRTIDTVSAVLIVTWGIFTLLSVLMFFFSVDFLVRGIGSWGITNQGFSGEYGRLWGIFQDPNYASVVSVVSIILSIRFIIMKKKVVLSIFASLNILFQLSYIVLGGSRACLIIMAVCTAVFAMWKMTFSKKLSIKNVGLGIAVSALSVLVVFGAVKVFKVVLPTVKGLAPDSARSAVVNAYDKLYAVSTLDYFHADDDTYPDDSQSGTDDRPDDIERTDLENMDDVSNGRFTRWKDTVSIFLKTPVFGTSPRNISAFAKEHCPDTLMAKYGIASHNGYLDILVSTGIIGFIILAAAVILGILKLIPMFFSVNSSIDICWFTLILSALAISAVFISDVFMIFSMAAFLFWLILGLALASSDKEPKSGIVQALFDKIFKRKKRS